MSDKNYDDFYPDLSGIFNIDEKDIPKVPIKKTENDQSYISQTRKKERQQRPERRPAQKRSSSDANSSVQRRSPQRNSSRQPEERVLTAERPERHLSPEERERRRKLKREKELKKAKTRLILILSAILIVIAGVFAIKGAIANSKKPVVTLEKTVSEPMERSYSSEAAVLKNPFGTYAVLIDNDYDVHYLEKKQQAEVILNEDTVFHGVVDKIQEEDQEGTFFEKIAAALLKEHPETSVYTVYISLSDPDGILKDGDKVNVKIITKSIDKAITVPTEAIRNDNGQSYVWLYHSIKKVISRQDISTGITADGKTEITAGLSKGDIVVKTFSCEEAELHNGMKVKTE